MRPLPPAVAAALATSLQAAHRALQRLDSDEVPAALRRVAAHSGRRLPPPLAASLLEALIVDDWLRQKALEQLPADTPEEDPSRSFLTQEEGWWWEVLDAALRRHDDRAAKQIAELERKAVKLEDRLQETQRRLKARGAESDGAGVEAERRVRDARKRAGEAVAAERKAAADLREAAAAATASAENAEQAAAELQALHTRAMARLRRARRERAELEAKLVSLRDGASPVATPVDLARDADRLAARAAGSISAPPAIPPGSGRRTPSLPAGVRPDTAAAIDWLVGAEGPMLVLVDAYNVSFHLAGEAFSTPLARQRLELELSRLAQRAPELRVVAIYDSSLAPGEGVASRRAGPIEVAFATGDETADDEIVARAEAGDGPVAVISTDREVRDRAAEAGAVTLWGEALVEWLRRRR